jgi:hypothetical protein
VPRRQVKEVPRWRRGQQQAAPQLVFSGRQAKKLARQVAATHLVNQPATTTKATNDVLARTGGYRFRHHLIPFWWLLAVISAGLITHEAHAAKLGLIIGLGTAAAIVLLTRHLHGFTRHASEAMALLTALWVPALALAGFVKPLPPVLLACWLCVLVPWVKHYRVRPEAVPEQPAPGDVDIWDRLAAKNKWVGHLDGCESLPGGGRQWGIALNGAETHIGQVVAEPRRIAAAWGKSITEAYAEASPDGIESRGRLTILKQNTLEKAREWDGGGIDPEVGMAVVGRFPDGQPVHERYFIRRNGVRHTVVAGADGSGKTGMLDLGLCMSATSGIIAPVILDPQEGQALPAWKDHVPYACGVDECMVYLRGLHAGMLSRSRDLGRLTWRTPDGDERTGMGFFDPFMTGLPIIEITLDEAPALLTDPKYGTEALWLLADTGKRGRKVGFRLRIAVQVPSLTELGGNAQALRSMLVGGNVFCGRTGDKVSGGMIGIAADPSGLPKYFADGEPTVGLGYASGPDNRPSTPTRWDWEPDPYKVARSATIRAFDGRLAEAMDRTIANSGVQLPLPSASAPLAAVPATDDGPEPEGRTCADAVLAVLDKAGAELDRGVIIERVRALSQEWGRPKPFSIRAIGLALSSLTSDGRIAKPQHNSYAPVRNSIHLVSGTAAAGQQASQG